ncbi:MAG: hypothetical protein M1816_005849 [Peltula sp. TS41687]|nr:MAG: hypothetical protein M1816_005849 [Peltula sp. TS41687]
MAEESATKRLGTSTPPLRIGTHNGHFHADEALAISLLRLHPTYTTSTLLRTRDPSLLSTCHTIVDVGGVYDPTQNRYDHHQRTFSHTFPGRPTKLSSAGLVWLHFGKAIIAASCGGLAEDGGETTLLWEKLYGSFIEAIDANDNGIGLYDTALLAAAGIERRFDAGAVNVSALVGDLNHNWNDPKPADPDAAQEAEDQRFLEASSFIGDVFRRKLAFYVDAWLPARSIVQEAYAARAKHDPRGRIVVFPQSVPWKDHLYTVEAEAEARVQADSGVPGDTEKESKVLYVLYPEDPSAPATSRWRIQCVPVTKDSFESRQALPEAWRGMRDEELDGLSGIPGCVFVHASGFIGGNRTWDGVRQMALKAVEM